MKIIEQHYLDNRRKLHRRLAFRLHSEPDAEDVLQTVYERALRYFHTFMGAQEDLDRWVNTLLNNALRDFKNEEKGITYGDFDEDDLEGVPCNYMSEQVVKEIYDLIDGKGDVQREVLGLYFQQDFSAKDISAITSHSYANAHKIIQRFKIELKEKYQ